MPAPILHRDLWPTAGNLVHTIATRGDLLWIFPSTLLAYRSAIYPQGMKFKYGLGGRLHVALIAQYDTSWRYKTGGRDDVINAFSVIELCESIFPCFFPVTLYTLRRGSGSTMMDYFPLFYTIDL